MKPPRASGVLDSPSRNLVLGLAYMAVVVAVATSAYTAAGWSLSDAVYMVVLTVYTVGYDEVRPIDTTLLRAITIGTIVLGCTGVIFLTGALVQFFTINQIDKVLGIRRMSTQIDALRNHVIICGFGRIGQQLAKGLSAGGAPFVVVELDPARTAEARGLGYLVIEADATDEETLLSAGVSRARALATVLAADAVNVFITLSARKLNAQVEIIARGEASSTESKLLQAGANRVVMPTHIGAERMVEMILFQETEKIIRGSESMRDFERSLLDLGLMLEIVAVAPDSQAVGQTVEMLEREAAGAFFIIQITRADGETIRRPEPADIIKLNDGVLLLTRGTRAYSLFEAAGRSFRKAAR